MFSCGVFGYLNDIDHATKILDRMRLKSKYVIGVFVLDNQDMKDAWLARRRKLIDDYDKRYEGLSGCFFTKDFFREYAAKYNLNVEFSHHELKGFFVENFHFDCLMYKK